MFIISITKLSIILTAAASEHRLFILLTLEAITSSAASTLVTGLNLLRGQEEQEDEEETSGKTGRF
uniref:Uncharacterized protein n=1 Tax=Cannabis sativa TaxID=3483 RepID=A0A803R7C8_CANSA